MTLTITAARLRRGDKVSLAHGRQVRQHEVEDVGPNGRRFELFFTDGFKKIVSANDRLQVERADAA